MQELGVLDTFGHFEDDFFRIFGLIEGVVAVERFRSEEHLHQTYKDLAIVLVVHLTTIKGLDQDGLECVPRDFGDINIVPRSHRVNVLVNEIQSAPLVSLIELVNLGPTNGSVSETFEDDCVQPADEEVKSAPLNGEAIGAGWGEYCLVGSQKGSLDACCRFEDEFVGLANEG